MVLQLEMLRFQQMVRHPLVQHAGLPVGHLLHGRHHLNQAPVPGAHPVRAAGATVLLNEPTYRTCPPAAPLVRRWKEFGASDSWRPQNKDRRKNRPPR